MDPRGKVAIVTGGASGIGRATATRLAAEGASVVVADLDETLGNQVVRSIENASGHASFEKVDVTSADDVQRMLEHALEKFGGLDILHNNAGIAVGTPAFPNTGLARWRRVLDIDLQAVVLGCYLAAPLMEQRGGGVIINTASMAGLYPLKEDPVYAAAKAGVVNFTYSLEPWASKRNIRVNCVCPGIVDTPLVRRGIDEANEKGYRVRLPATIIQPDAIAEAVLQLVKDDQLAGRALEVRPGGAQFVEPRRAPKPANRD